MFIAAIVAFFTCFMYISRFGVISENVTMKIRSALYVGILRKNIGWFDEKDNAPGVLSATMASDA